METAGASSGAIIIGGAVQAQFVNRPTICSIPLDSWNDGCRAIVEYVTRTLDSLVIADATTEKEFGFIESNPYIVQNNIKSVLCMPVTHQNTLKAILYVENNLMSNCFTEERIDTLSILTTQMAISLENSLSFKTRLQALEELAEVQRVRAHEADLYRKKQEEFIDRICHEIRNPVQGIMYVLLTLF
jgi:GAF domain-containing protein